jgi:hypothetical protein
MRTAPDRRSDEEAAARLQLRDCANGGETSNTGAEQRVRVRGRWPIGRLAVRTDAAPVRNVAAGVAQWEALELVEEGLAGFVVVEKLHPRVLPHGERQPQLLRALQICTRSLQEIGRLVGDFGELVARDVRPCLVRVHNRVTADGESGTTANEGACDGRL